MIGLDLNAWQRQFQAVLQNPKSQRRQSLLETIRKGFGLPPDARMAIYTNAYKARLLESLKDQFPVLLKVLEPATFEWFATSFIAQCPPSGHSLLEMGEAFVSWLTNTRPANEKWADFVCHLARYEQCRKAVYNGPGHESWPKLEQASAGTASQIHTLVVTPSLVLFESTWPVDDYLSAIRLGQTPNSPEESPIRLAIYRHSWQVRSFRLSEPQWRWLVHPDTPISCERLAAKWFPVHLSWIETGLMVPSPNRCGE